ncbi:RecX family transcriptional regulator [Candidatus Saccharibacteria bacterium]|nr:RecX family transcriptional regulator [Candidatus Saccharibacteria bacterium]
MEIYKLSDEISDSKSAQLKITDIRQAVRNENRVNVFVNDKYAFSLDIAQVVDLGVKVGRVISAEELADFKEASEFGKAYQRALEWVLIRPRSIQELKDYLKRRQARGEAEDKKQEWKLEREVTEMVARGEEVNAKRLEKRILKLKEKPKYDFSELIIERLVERGYVDDFKFAEYYVQNRFVKKGISQKRLKMELYKKGISEEIIEQVLGERNEEEEILKIIAKKRAKYDNEKLVGYLCRQGFSYDLARNLVEKTTGDD